MKPITRSFENVLLALFGLAGLLVFILLFPRVQPAARLGLEVGRAEALRIAQAALPSGITDGATFADRSIHFSFEGQYEGFARATGDTSLRKQLEAHAPSARWVVRFDHPESGTSFRIYVGPHGDVFGSTHQRPSEEAGSHLDQGTARDLARDALSARMPVDWSLYQEVDAQTINLSGRSDHSFTWEHPDSSLAGARLRLTATVAGDTLSSWQRSVAFPADFNRLYTGRQTSSRTANIIALILYIVLWIVAIFLFALRFKASEVSVRNGLLMAAAMFALFAVFFVDIFASLEVPLEGAVGQSATILYINIGLQIFFTCLGFFFIWITGESHTRDRWPGKLRVFDGIFARFVASSDLGRSVLRGYALGFGMLGVWYGGMYLAIRVSDIWATVGPSEQQILSSASLSLAPWPPLAPFAYAGAGALLASGYLFLFGQALLHRLTRHYGLAAAIGALLAGAVFFDYTVTYPHGGTALVGVAFAAAMYAFYRRYDLFGVFVGLFIVQITPYLSTLVLQPAGDLLSSGVSGFALLLLGLVFGVWARLNGRALRDDEIAPVYVRHISERQRLRLELDIARRAQLLMLPQRLPQISGLDIAAFSEPAREVGGDYFDFFELGPDQFGFAVGDVSGKGMPAALYMTLLKGSLQAQANAEASPATILSRINRSFFASAEANTFVTLTYGIIQLKEGLLTFARAGHNPMIVHRPKDGSFYYLQPPGIGIGLERGEVFDRVLREERFPLLAGDVLVLYTDGLTDGRNSREELFGEERIAEIIKTHPDAGAEQLLSALRDGYRNFIGRAEPYDDLTCVVIRLTS